jgi:hypothetical protein
MKNGLYTVKFINSDNSDWGSGVVAINDGCINGGDFGYVYQGRFTRQEYDMDLNVKATQWNSECTSIFGDVKEFDLRFDGKFSPDDDSVTLSGVVVNHPEYKMTLQMNYFGELVK